MSVDAAQVKPIWVVEEAVAARPDGAVGGVVSEEAEVVAVAMFE